MSESLLEIKGLKKYFPVTKGMLGMKRVGWIKAVDGVSLVIGKGKTLGLVGESGCGKTTTANMVLRLISPTEGSIFFHGKDISGFAGSELKAYRASVQAVFQDPFGSLSPRMRVGNIISEPLEVAGRLSKTELRTRVAELLDLVGLEPDRARYFPHEFSGGQRQRIAIARALSSNSQLIVLDEPVSALDVSIRAQIINLLMDLQKRLSVSYLLVGHDLPMVGYMSHQVAVMYLGKIVELGESEEISFHHLHPYSQALYSASLPAHPDEKGGEVVVSGEVPSPFNPPSGCHFHPRCTRAGSKCSKDEPQLREVAIEHWVACHSI